MDRCIHLQQFAETQKKVLETHISQHKWFRGITDDNIAIRDFIKSFGGIMRTTYCLGCCPLRDECNLKKS